MILISIPYGTFHPINCTERVKPHRGFTTGNPLFGLVAVNLFMKGCFKRLLVVLKKPIVQFRVWIDQPIDPMPDIRLGSKADLLIFRFGHFNNTFRLFACNCIVIASTKYISYCVTDFYKTSTLPGRRKMSEKYYTCK